MILELEVNFSKHAKGKQFKLCTLRQEIFLLKNIQKIFIFHIKNEIALIKRLLP